MVIIIVGAYFGLTLLLCMLAFLWKVWLGVFVSIPLIGAMIYYIMLSATTISEDRLAGRKSLGKFEEELTPGFHIIWHFLEEVVEVSTNTHEQDVPASPELIDHVDRSKPKADGSPGDGVPPPGMVPALRVTFVEKVELKDGKPVPFEVRSRVDMGLDGKGKVIATLQPDDSFLKRHTAEYEASFGFVVLGGNDNFKTFYTTIGSVKKAKQNMMDFVISVLSGQLQTYCAGEAMLLKDEIEKEVGKQLASYCEKTWGIKVTFFRMKPFSFSHDFNISLSKSAEANEKAKERLRLSVAERDALGNEGQGRADAELSMLTARANGVKKMAELAQTPEGQFVIANESARVIAKESTVIVPDGNIFGGVLGVANVIQKRIPPVVPQAPVTTPTAAVPANSTTPTEKREPKKPEPKSSIVLTDDPAFPNRERRPRPGKRRK